MYQQLIVPVIQKILKTIKEELESVWVKAKQAEIERLTEEEIKRQQIKLAKRYRCDSSYQGETKLIHDIPIPEADAWRVFVGSTTIRKFYEDQYRQEFKDSLWLAADGFKVKLERQIERLEPGQALSLFYARHPWLKQELHSVSSSETITAHFLIDFIEGNLLEILIEPKLRSWRDISEKELVSKRLAWNDLKHETLATIIEGYPLSKIHFFYMQRQIFDLPNIMIPVALANMYRLRQPFARVDLFRYLANNYANQITAGVAEDGRLCTRMAPMHHSDLPHLSQAQWRYYDTILANIASEDAPLWIALHKQNGGFTAYLPANIQPLAIEKRLRSIIPPEVRLHFQPIDYSQNVTLNDLDNLSAEMCWHVVLLERVLLWCQQNKPGSLASFRNRVPLPVMLERVIEGCISVDLHGRREKIHRAYVNRKPLSNCDIEEVYRLRDSEFQNMEHLLSDRQKWTTFVSSSQIIAAFDKQLLNISPNLETLTIGGDRVEADSFAQAMSLVYHHQFSRLIMPPIHTGRPEFCNELLEVDVCLRTVKPSKHLLSINQANYDCALSTAARNRFWAEVNPAYIEDAKKNIFKRKALWQLTGRELVTFFEKQAKSLDLDFIKRVQQFNSQWLQTYCDHQARGNLASTEWAFAQIAQMGTKSLDSLFAYLENSTAARWSAVDKEPAPKLNAAFDLKGSLTEGPTAYILKLATLIRGFDRAKKGCTPLFNSLSLILPNSMGRTEEEALVQLISILDARRKAFPKEDLAEIVLYNLPIEDTNSRSSHFIRTLKEL